MPTYKQTFTNDLLAKLARGIAKTYIAPVTDGSVTFPIHRTGRTLFYAFCIITMNAGTGEMIITEWIFITVYRVDTAIEKTHFQIVFVLTCHLADIAADAFLLVVDKSETLHRKLLYLLD
jgi:hypothetical protein